MRIWDIPDVCLSYSLSSLSHEVVLFHPNLKLITIKEITAMFIGTFTQKVIKTTIIKSKWVHLYRLNSIKSPFGLFFGLFPLLKKLKPEIIQIGEANSFLLFQVYIYSFFLDYIITVECHIHLSVYNAAKNLIKYIKIKILKIELNFLSES